MRLHLPKEKEAGRKASLLFSDPLRMEVSAKVSNTNLRHSGYFSDMAMKNLIHMAMPRLYYQHKLPWGT